MDVGKIIITIILGALGILTVYIVARLVSAAYFNSKHDYESRKSNPNAED